MKVTKKEITCVFLLVSVISLAVCDTMESRAARLEEVETAITRTKSRLQKNALRLREFERRHQAEMASLQEFLDRLTNVTSAAEVLHRISRSSTRDLRALTKDLKHKSDAAL